MIACVDVDQRGMLRNAGVARCGIKRIALRRLRELPRQRMFAATRSDQQDIHGRRLPQR